jgi:hypothetical protein
MILAIGQLVGGRYSYKATLTIYIYQMALLNIETSRIYPIGLRAFLKIVFFYDLFLPTWIPRSLSLSDLKGILCGKAILAKFSDSIR